MARAGRSFQPSGTFLQYAVRLVETVCAHRRFVSGSDLDTIDTDTASSCSLLGTPYLGPIPGTRERAVN